MLANHRESLCAEIDNAVCSWQMLLHGTDTVERFKQFSMSEVIAEVQSCCPEVYKLVEQLGSTQRNARDGALSYEELKGVMAIWGDREWVYYVSCVCNTVVWP